MNGDLISRSALLATFHKEDERSEGVPWDISAIEAEIEDAPAVDAVEVVHGRWEFEDDNGAYPWTTKAICSECKEVVAWNATLFVEARRDDFVQEHLYCPKCGAKMDGGEDDGT